MTVLVAFFVLILIALALFLIKGFLLILAGLLVVVLAPFVLFASIGASILGDFFKLMGGGSNRGHDYRRHHGCRCHGGRRR